MKVEIKDLERAFNKAKVGIIAGKSVFLSTILFSLKHVWDESIQTANVDGITMRLNPDWFYELPSQNRSVSSRELACCF